MYGAHAPSPRQKFLWRKRFCDPYLWSTTITLRTDKCHLSYIVVYIGVKMTLYMRAIV